MSDPAKACLERYREIIPDWGSFSESIHRPPPTDARTNTLRTDPDALQRRLEERGIGIQRLSWAPIVLRADRAIGALLEHWLGLYYIQEAAQAIPVLALDPQPGERVLDLCAAPGGKTTDIVARMENRGLVVANEPAGRRHPSLLSNLNRWGALNVLVTEYAGERFPTSTRFDRALVDAPCSAEGTLRKDASLRDGAPIGRIRRLAALQRQLITRAFDVLRPGGILVYATCTFAPEENEAVVAHLLRERRCRIEPLPPGLPGLPGLTLWDGERFPDDLRHARRIYPHQIDSGGGFVARIVAD